MRKQAGVSAVAVLFSSSLAGVAPEQVAPTALPACSTIRFIGLKGLNENSDKESDVINATWDRFKRTSETSGVGTPFRESVNYPKVAPTRLVSDIIVADTFSVVIRAGVTSAVDRGVEAVNAAIDDVRKKCPDAKFVLAGYSLGAWIVDQFLKTTPLQSIVLAAILYGDPQWNGAGVRGIAQSYDGTALSGPYPPLADRVQSLCNHHDPICGIGYEASEKGMEKRAADLGKAIALAAEGKNCGPHCGYVGGPTTQGGDFLESRSK
ncbi:cutinase family protein [Streptomyces ipomoeae]|uniref:Cutinase family protein n=1 Tax=Streptomyces ipomoeae TaxID=103232 RepID=A0AAE9B1A5_9ACTN|nr:cutinase family protein [Streptomyces ipomoeae]TQE36850.1 cutinase family protein [Streptomyces ipomoeae]